MPEPISATLISPLIDNLMIGGLSIIVMVFYWMFVDPNAMVFYSVTVTAYVFSFLVNMPHFLASYQLLYGDYRKLILQKKSFFWAAVLSPLLIIAGLSYGIYTKSASALSLMIQGMYFSVGWHYIKQIYGTALVTSAIQNRYFGKWEKILILFNLYSVWAMSWISSNLTQGAVSVYGISYLRLGFPPILLTLTYFMIAISFVLAIMVGLRKYLKTGERPATSSLICFASIYLWYIPTLYHPSFFYFIPLFHSLQYLLFMGTLKRNQALAESVKAADPEKQRILFFKKFWGFFGLAIILGALTMDLIPKFLDQKMPITGEGLGPMVWFLSFNVFINIHHYFIDNVIWRGDNPFLKEHLFQASAARAFNLKT